MSGGGGNLPIGGATNWMNNPYGAVQSNDPAQQNTGVGSTSWAATHPDYNATPGTPAWGATHPDYNNPNAPGNVGSTGWAATHPDYNAAPGTPAWGATHPGYTTPRSMRFACSSWAWPWWSLPRRTYACRRGSRYRGAVCWRRVFQRYGTVWTDSWRHRVRAKSESAHESAALRRSGRRQLRDAATRRQQ